MSTSQPVPWTEFSHDPRRPESSGLRASDRDRDLVLRVLAEGFADGRLDRAEYDERADAVARARTLDDLPPLLADLVPSAPVPARGSDLALASPADLRAMAVEDYERSRRNALSAALGSAVVLTLFWWVLGHGFYWPVFFLIGTVGNALRLVTRRQDYLADKVRELEKKQRKELERGQRPADDE